jgi:uncharacterized protein YjbI with pentapeptide repeats
MDWTVVAVIALGAGGGSAALLGTWWLWWRLPKRYVDRLSLKIRDAKARADVEDNFRKTIGQFLGGAAVLLGTGFAYMQFTQQQRASHELLISNQIVKGFEQLSSTDKPMLMLGGVYALEGVMNTSEQYHQPVLEALSAFVRYRTGTPMSSALPATEIQAALTVIGRREPTGIEHIDLNKVHISQVNLVKANLTGANLTGVDLSGANLTGAQLLCADLTSADLRGATLSLTDLTGAELWGTILRDLSLNTVVGLKRAHNLNRAILLSTDLRGADLTGVDLSGADLTGANLSGASLSGTNLSGATLTSATLSAADLRGADLSRANLTGGATLNVADLRGAKLHEADLTGADLTGAKMPSEQDRVEIPAGESAIDCRSPIVTQSRR